jgi:hypothetical protein
MSTGTDGGPSPSGAPEPAEDTVPPQPPADDVSPPPPADDGSPPPPADDGSPPPPADDGSPPPPADDGSPEPPADAPPAKPRTGTTTARERAERQRDEKLESIKEQVQSGSLVIRQMTDEERERYPAREEPPKRPRSR